LNEKRGEITIRVAFNDSAKSDDQACLYSTRGITKTGSVFDPIL